MKICNILLNCVFIVFILLIGCSNNKDYKNTVLKPEKEYIQLNDKSGNPIYINSIRSLASVGSNLFISDYKNNQIFRIDSVMNVISVYGNSGSGPGEFKGAASIIVKRDTLYAIDDGNHRINIFDLKGEYKRSILLPTIGSIRTKFAIDDNNDIYLASTKGNNPIIKMDKTGKVIKEFGEIYSFDGKTNIYRNIRHLLYYQNKIISVLNSEAIIEIYDLNGVLIQKYDFSKLGVFQNQIRRQNNKYIEKKFPSNYSIEFFADVCIFDNNLALLYWDCDNNGENPKSNKVLLCNVSDKSIEPRETITLSSLNNNDGSNSCIVFSTKNKLYAFQGNESKLKAYKIDYK